MKIFYLNALYPLFILLLCAFSQNAGAKSTMAAKTKFVFKYQNLEKGDTSNRVSKKTNTDPDRIAEKNQAKDEDADKKSNDDKNNHEEDREGDVKARYKQEFERKKDIKLNIVPVERLIEARKIKDQIITTRTTFIKNQNVPGGVNLPANSISNIQWTERGPTNIGGRTRALMFDLNDAANGYKKVFAGGVDGGLWFTTDITAAPVSWHKINDFFDNIAISC